jgi:regulator of sigma E protease
MAKAFGVAIERFSIGFGSALAQWTDKSGVEWRLGWAPIGGYVKFAGDANAASMAPTAEDLAALKTNIVAAEGVGAESRYFQFKPVWQRTLITLAGPGANFILAIALFATLALGFGETVPKARISSVVADSPAKAAGFLPGDLITAVNGHPIADFSELTTYCALRAGDAIRFSVTRNGVSQAITATPIRKPRVNPITGEISKMGYLGVGASGAPDNLIHRRYGPIDALQRGVQRSFEQIQTTVFYMSRIVRGAESGDQLRSFLGIARASGDFAKEGAYGAPNVGAKILGVVVAMSTLIAALSVNIGFANLLPIPVLDGGHLLFYAYEAAARRPLNARIQAAGYRVGLALLLCLMLFATWNDLQQPHILKFLGGLFS